jgi:hypothetical protein
MGNSLAQWYSILTAESATFLSPAAAAFRLTILTTNEAAR